MVSPGLGVALPLKRSLELTFTDRITNGIEGNQADWSAAMADELQLLGLNPLRRTTDGPPKFRKAGAVGPLALGQNRACPLPPFDIIEPTSNGRQPRRHG